MAAPGGRPSVEVRLALGGAELVEIKALQTANLAQSLSETERDREGFVTAVYSLDFLERMHALSPAVVAVAEGRLVGYVLAATKYLGADHPLLGDLFAMIDQCAIDGRSLADAPYILCGQLCVAKDYRGQGLVQSMYACYREHYGHSFDYCITDIDRNNPRSLKAHLKAGFQVIHSFPWSDRIWDIVLLKLR